MTWQFAIKHSQLIIYRSHRIRSLLRAISKLLFSIEIVLALNCCLFSSSPHIICTHSVLRVFIQDWVYVYICHFSREQLASLTPLLPNHIDAILILRLHPPWIRRRLGQVRLNDRFQFICRLCLGKLWLARVCSFSAMLSWTYWTWRLHYIRLHSGEWTRVYFYFIMARLLFDSHSELLRA